MGYSTQYIGGPRVDPPLNTAEIAWLRAYCATTTAEDDPYFVAMNPGADHLLRSGMPDAASVTLDLDGVRDSVGRDWSSTAEGCHLRWVDRSRSNDAIRQLEYLIDHFFGPDAAAATTGQVAFSEFTFDHVLSGFVAAERDDGRLTLVRIHNNEVVETVLTPGADDLIW